MLRALLGAALVWRLVAAAGWAVAPAWAGGPLAVVATSTDLKALVEEVGGDRVRVDALAPPLQDRDHHDVGDADPSHQDRHRARTSGDPVLLERLAANLVDNAVRHNVSRLDPGDDWRAGRVAFLDVSSTGPVIPAGVADTLFERFRRLDPTPGGPGLGLGLAIVRSVATATTARCPPGAGRTEASTSPWSCPDPAREKSGNKPSPGDEKLPGFSCLALPPGPGRRVTSS